MLIDSMLLPGSWGAAQLIFFHPCTASCLLQHAASNSRCLQMHQCHKAASNQGCLTTAQHARPGTPVQTATVLQAANSNRRQGSNCLSLLQSVLCSYSSVSTSVSTNACICLCGHCVMLCVLVMMPCMALTRAPDDSLTQASNQVPAARMVAAAAAGRQQLGKQLVDQQ